MVIARRVEHCRHTTTTEQQDQQPFWWRWSQIFSSTRDHCMFRNQELVGCAQVETATAETKEDSALLML